MTRVMPYSPSGALSEDLLCLWSYGRCRQSSPIVARANNQHKVVEYEPHRLCIYQVSKVYLLLHDGGCYCVAPFATSLWQQRLFMPGSQFDKSSSQCVYICLLQLVQETMLSDLPIAIVNYCHEQLISTYKCDYVCIIICKTKIALYTSQEILNAVPLCLCNTSIVKEYNHTYLQGMNSRTKVYLGMCMVHLNFCNCCDSYILRNPNCPECKETLIHEDGSKVYLKLSSISRYTKYLPHAYL